MNELKMSTASREIDGMADTRQIQCQRTRRFISASTSDSTVICPWCAERETYQRLGLESEVWHHVQHATQVCRIEFEVPDDGREAFVWLGDRPETVFEDHLNRHNIYLGRDSDRWQLMYSGAHEVFHRVCGERKNQMHWADEMFAVLFSLLYLERIAETAHAEKNREELIESAQLMSRHEMLAVTVSPLPDEFYGRAYLTGEELREIAGWEELKLLAVLRTPAGLPDVERWLVSLPLKIRKRVQPLVLGSP